MLVEVATALPSPLTERCIFQQHPGAVFSFSCVPGQCWLCRRQADIGLEWVAPWRALLPLIFSQDTSCPDRWNEECLTFDRQPHVQGLLVLRSSHDPGVGPQVTDCRWQGCLEGGRQSQPGIPRRWLRRVFNALNHYLLQTTQLYPKFGFKGCIEDGVTVYAQDVKFSRPFTSASEQCGNECDCNLIHSSHTC